MYFIGPFLCAKGKMNKKMHLQFKNEGKIS